MISLAQDHLLPRGCTTHSGLDPSTALSIKKTLLQASLMEAFLKVLSSQMTLTCVNWYETSHHTPPNFISSDTVHFVITVEYRVRLLQS